MPYALLRDICWYSQVVIFTDQIGLKLKLEKNNLIINCLRIFPTVK